MEAILGHENKNINCINDIVNCINDIYIYRQNSILCIYEILNGIYRILNRIYIYKILTRLNVNICGPPPEKGAYGW